MKGGSAAVDDAVNPGLGPYGFAWDEVEPLEHLHDLVDADEVIPAGEDR